jgi:hypothetical protein
MRIPNRSAPPPGRADPSSLIAVILIGSRLPSTVGAPNGLAMPAFGWRYDDADITALATFVRWNWGNRITPVAAAQTPRFASDLVWNGKSLNYIVARYRRVAQSEYVRPLGPVR